MERDYLDNAYRLTLTISTHTLTWSVTYDDAEIYHYKANFNSHAHVERDYHDFCYAAHKRHFNSHAHVERDIPQNVIEKMKAISTHTLTWSVTIDLTAMFGSNNISTHTLTWSVTDDIIDVDANEEISTHTLTWSVTV